MKHLEVIQIIKIKTWKMMNKTKMHITVHQLNFKNIKIHFQFLNKHHNLQNQFM